MLLGFQVLSVVLLLGSSLAQDVEFELGNLGSITGKTIKTKEYPNAPFSGRDYYTFRNIPYANSVINEYRYTQSTLRNTTKLSEQGSYDATRDGPLCIQGSTSPEELAAFTSTKTINLLSAVVCDLSGILCDSEQDYPTLNAFLQILELILEIPPGVLSGADKTVETVLHEWLDITLSMSEECLQLSVATPHLPDGIESSQLPVMMFIHGGAFYAGTHIRMGADRLGSWEDVIIVGINYRLGNLGFLCLDTDEASGNMGMIDMLVALEWVHQYIGYFGGDHNKITIFGESAGSASINHLLLSQEANGLYARGIGQSGSALASWAFDHDPEYHGVRIASKAGCDLENHDEIVACLRSRPAIDISLAFRDYRQEDRAAAGMGFGGSIPCAQKKGNRKFYDAAKGETPERLILEGNFNHVPIMFGANSYEGSYVYGVVYNEFMVPNNFVDDEEFLTHDLIPQLLKTVGVSNAYAMEESIKKEYFRDWQMGNLTLMQPGIIDLLSNFFLKASSFKTVQENSNYKDSYWYSFDYKAEQKSLFHALFADTAKKGGLLEPGVCHADELMYIFDVELPLALCDLGVMLPEMLQCLLIPENCLPETDFSKKWHHCLTGKLTDEELEVSAIMAQLWTNFAVRGEPGFDLQPWSRYSPSYISIDRSTTIKEDYTDTYHVALDDSLANPETSSSTMSPETSTERQTSTSDFSSVTSTERETTTSDSSRVFPSLLAFVSIFLNITGRNFF